MRITSPAPGHVSVTCPTSTGFRPKGQAAPRDFVTGLVGFLWKPWASGDALRLHGGCHGPHVGWRLRLVVDQ